MKVLAILLLVQAAMVADAPVDRVADALAAGDAADSGAALLAAVQRLERLSARPGDGQDDLATIWRARAAALGVRAKAMPTRGRALGPAYRGGLLGPGGRIDIDQIFLGGETAVVVVVPQQGRALQVGVYGADRERICDQAVAPPKVSCRWLPIFTTRYRISLSNPASIPSRYYLVSN